jgi:hypothetical protein
MKKKNKIYIGSAKIFLIYTQIFQYVQAGQDEVVLVLDDGLQAQLSQR